MRPARRNPPLGHDTGAPSLFQPRQSASYFYSRAGLPSACSCTRRTSARVPVFVILCGEEIHPMPSNRGRKKPGKNVRRTAITRGAAKPTGRGRPRFGETRIKWANIRPLSQSAGEDVRRFYRIESLASGVEVLLQGRDAFIKPSIQQVLGPAPLAVLSFELVQETKYALTFRLRASNSKRKQGSFAFVAAKQHGGFSDILEEGRKNLHLLHKRAENLVVKPFLGGTVRLPDAKKSSEKDRKVYCCLTQWLGGLVPLGLGADAQFTLETAPPEAFSREDTDYLKARIVELVARTYDPAQQRCMETPQIPLGDFMASKPKRGAPRLKLIGCRRILSNVSPERMIHMCASATNDADDRSFSLAPEDPRLIHDGLARAVGREKAAHWMRAYAAALARGELREPASLTREDAEQLAGRA
jgi:hypothetical protein